MCRLFPCIPIFRGFFQLKVYKQMCLSGGVKNCIVTCKKGILLVWVRVSAYNDVG